MPPVGFEPKISAGERPCVHFPLFIPSSKGNILLLVLAIRTFPHKPHHSHISCDDLLSSELTEARVLRFQHFEIIHPAMIFLISVHQNLALETDNNLLATNFPDIIPVYVGSSVTTL